MKVEAASSFNVITVSISQTRSVNSPGEAQYRIADKHLCLSKTPNTHSKHWLVIQSTLSNFEHASNVNYWREHLTDRWLIPMNQFRTIRMLETLERAQQAFGYPAINKEDPTLRAIRSFLIV
jgi:hypothetical protein